MCRAAGCCAARTTGMMLSCQTCADDGATLRRCQPLPEPPYTSERRDPLPRLPLASWRCDTLVRPHKNAQSCCMDIICSRFNKPSVTASHMSFERCKLGAKFIAPKAQLAWQLTLAEYSASNCNVKAVLVMQSRTKGVAGPKPLMLGYASTNKRPFQYVQGFKAGHQRPPNLSRLIKRVPLANVYSQCELHLSRQTAHLVNQP